jgi:hypothetical protein
MWVSFISKSFQRDCVFIYSRVSYSQSSPLSALDIIQVNWSCPPYHAWNVILMELLEVVQIFQLLGGFLEILVENIFGGFLNNWVFLMSFELKLKVLCVQFNLPLAKVGRIFGLNVIPLWLFKLLVIFFVSLEVT